MYCECGCGQVTNISQKTSKARGHIKGQHQRFMPSHRAPKYEDLSIRTFDRLKPVEYFPDMVLPDGSRTHAKWRCECECGNETLSRPDALKNGESKSCGCSRTERLEKFRYRGRLPLGFAQMRGVFFHYQSTARRRGYEFSLSYEEAMRIFTSNCHYCGMPPSNIKKMSYNEHDFIYSGIDRINSSLGYVAGNCVPCCRRCNVAKNDMGYDQFLEHISRIYLNLVATNMAAD